MKHERVADEQADAGRAAIPLHLRLLHVVQCIHHCLQFNGIGGRNGFPIFTQRGPRIASVEDALRPRCDFVLPDFGLEEGRGQSGFPIALVIVPVVIGIILDGVVQIPDAATGGAHEILHRAVFQKRSLEGSFLEFAAIDIRRARGAGPDLRDVTIATFQLRETGLGTNYVPRSVVQETMRRHIAMDVAAGALVIILHIGKDLLQRAAIEKVFQLGRAPLGINRDMRCLPGFAVVTLPFAFETFRVTTVHPELRLLQMDCFRARIQRALHADTKKLSIVRAGTHVIDIAAVAALAAVAHGLRLVFVIDSVKAAIEIVLVITP